MTSPAHIAARTNLCKLRLALVVCEVSLTINPATDLYAVWLASIGKPRNHEWLALLLPSCRRNTLQGSPIEGKPATLKITGLGWRQYWTFPCRIAAARQSKSPAHPQPIPFE